MSASSLLRKSPGFGVFGGSIYRKNIGFGVFGVFFRSAVPLYVGSALSACLCRCFLAVIVVGGVLVIFLVWVSGRSVLADLPF